VEGNVLKTSVKKTIYKERSLVDVSLPRRNVRFKNTVTSYLQSTEKNDIGFLESRMLLHYDSFYLIMSPK
jgi:hypothetical protein